MSNPWSMKDREFIALARAKVGADEMARRLNISMKSVSKTAKRLGVSIGRKAKK